MIGSKVESRIAREAETFRRAHKVSLHVAIDQVLQVLKVAPEDRRALYFAVERRIKEREKKIKKVNDLVKLTSAIYNDPKQKVGMPDAISVALNRAGVENREERDWLRTRGARRLQIRSVAKAGANKPRGKRSKRVLSEADSHF